ncbi:MAG: glutamate-1-semialdehyde 2,1-aminomutase [Myxococcales bacterium]|nr:glutamate-1-semialdehyde 2,1-aminomutase [Myxococcales bacterium]
MALKRDQSQMIFERGAKVIPGGVNSPVRAFRAVQGKPVVIHHAKGPEIWDVDGNKYIDYVASWGPMILGHAPKSVIAAVTEAASRGTSFGACTEAEVDLAEQLVRIVPSLEKVRMVNSGTEATMSALRLARGFTKRDKIIKIIGGYHGHVDALLVKAGSGAATFGVPDSAGVPAGTAQDTLLVEFNDLDAVRAHFEAHAGAIAAIIVEPVPGNMGCVPPGPGYLEGLRELTRAHGALLIFDEVMCGFRVALGGAQARYGVTPDLTCLGKIIGGGLPAAAYGGKAEIMNQVSPDGPVYQAGTLSGNPLAVAAGRATLELLERDNPYAELESRTARLCKGMLGAAEEIGVPMTVNQVGSMFTAFFNEGPVTDFASAKRSDTALFSRFHHEMLERGIYLAPSQFEAGFVSVAHLESHLDRTLEAGREALRAAVASGTASA